MDPFVLFTIQMKNDQNFECNIKFDLPDIQYPPFKKNELCFHLYLTDKNIRLKWFIEQIMIAISICSDLCSNETEITNKNIV